MGMIVVLTGVLMAIPLVVALAFAEYSCAADFLFSAGVCILIGAVLMLLKPNRLDRRRSLLLCGFGWVIVGVLAAIPLYLSGDFKSFLDATFDAVSALTTTGVSVVDDIDRISYSQVTWRAVLSLMGAQCIIIMAMYLGFFGTGGYTPQQNAAARHASYSSHNVRLTGRYVLVVAGGTVLVGTIGVFVICLVHGFNAPDALMNGFWLSTNAYSTGSFIPHTSSLIFYHSTWLNAFLSMLMILGAINFSIYAMAIHGQHKVLFNNSESRFYIVWITLLVIIVSIVQSRDGIFSSLSGLFDHGTFMVIAAATTSGMQTVYPEQIGITFASGAFILIMAAMVVGSASNSTGGGIKIFRIQRLLHWFAYTVRKALTPDTVRISMRYNHFGTRTMTPGGSMLAMVITTLYIAAAALGAMLFIAHGYDALESICESISYVTNSGFSTGITSDTMTLDLELMAMLLMWAGRLEFVALIAMVLGLVASVVPQRNYIPKGAANTRKSQRHDRMRKRLHRITGIFKSSDGFAQRVCAFVLAVAIAAFALAPLALAAESDQGESADTTYRSVSISELLSATERLDGMLVEVTGEVMGQVTEQGPDYAWLNIKQDDAMIGVLVTTAQAQAIANFGGYTTSGDVVCVRGTFNLSCAEHSNELEIHAASLTIEEQGTAYEHPVSSKRLTIGVFLIVLGVLVLLVGRLLRPKQRKRHAKMGWFSFLRRKQ